MFQVGNIINFVYHNRPRRGEIVMAHPWGVTVWVYGEGFKAFRFEKIKAPALVG